MITVDNINHIKTMLLSLKYFKDNIKIIDIDELGRFKKIEYNKVIYEFEPSNTMHHLYSNTGMEAVVSNPCMLTNDIGETIVGCCCKTQEYLITTKDFEHVIKLTEDYKINIDGLDKSLLEWNEEDLLYYTLKNT